jgi:hypothetical protein
MLAIRNLIANDAEKIHCAVGMRKMRGVERTAWSSQKRYRRFAHQRVHCAVGYSFQIFSSACSKKRPQTEQRCVRFGNDVPNCQQQYEVAEDMAEAEREGRSFT